MEISSHGLSCISPCIMAARPLISENVVQQFLAFFAVVNAFFNLNFPHSQWQKNCTTAIALSALVEFEPSTSPPQQTSAYTLRTDTRFLAMISGLIQLNPYENIYKYFVNVFVQQTLITIQHTNTGIPASVNTSYQCCKLVTCHWLFFDVANTLGHFFKLLCWYQSNFVLRFMTYGPLGVGIHIHSHGDVSAMGLQRVYNVSLSTSKYP
jgi:hypothetical protein